jgi:outer membrane protein assembly factor BamB
MTCGRWFIGAAVLLAASMAWAGAPAASAATQGDWPGWRGPNRDGKSTETGLLKDWPSGGPRQLWQVSGIGRGFSTVAVASGVVYTTGDVGDQLMLFAFDLAGKKLWEAPAGPAWKGSHPGSRSTPVIDEGRVYLVNANGPFGCFDAKTGRPIWGRRMQDYGGRLPGWAYAESVLIAGELAIVTPGGQNPIVALNKRSGEPVWASRGFSAGAQYGSLLYFEHEKTPLIAAGTAGGIFVVDARTGELRFGNDFCAGNTANCPTPAYADGHLFWSNGYGKGGICLKLTGSGRNVGAEVAWTTRELISHHGGYIIKDGYIYGNHEGGYACLELKTGQQRWFERSVGKGSILYADGMLYVFGERGGRAGLLTCSPEGTQSRGTFSVSGEDPSWAHPVIAGGRLYLRYGENLYCFAVK